VASILKRIAMPVKKALKTIPIAIGTKAKKQAKKKPPGKKVEQASLLDSAIQGAITPFGA
jgi:hypothetical protein